MQELVVFVVKALSKDNGADDICYDALEVEGGVQRGSWRMRKQDRRHEDKELGNISHHLYLCRVPLSLLKE